MYTRSPVNRYPRSGSQTVSYTHLERAAAIAKSLGLAWGGDWSSIVDKPHLYLPDWGSTPTQLIQTYGTPEEMCIRDRTGNAQAAHVLAGETFYTNNYKTKLTGTMTVNSLLNFSVAAYSGRRVLAKWQNPNQAAGKPFSGVKMCIRDRSGWT